MSKIRMLSESMIGKIAAGEVVERPASAIKELIENSLDAGATAVTAEIRDGGMSYIRVTDNGSGIDESDIRMAFERHATSKISREQDLTSIATLGFRGEALASIAAVSHVSLITRTADRDTGLKVVNEGGKIDFVECTTDKLLINDGCQIYSYHEMVNQLTLKHKNDIGVFEELVKFERSGELSTPSMKLKIFGYFVKYEIKKPEEITFTVDLSDYLYGVIEYLSKEQKTLFWLNGKITKVPLIEK